MRLSIGASFAWKQDDKALDHAISGEKASFKGLRSTERSLWSRVSDSNTLDTSDLRIWKSERTTICICMPLRATWCLPLSPLSLNLRLHLVDFLIQPEMKMQQAFWTFLSEAQRSSMIPWVPFCFFTFFGFHPYWLNAMAIREQPASKKSKPRGVCFSFQLGLATAASCMWYIIIAYENEPWFKSVQSCFMTELGSFAFRQNQLLMQVLKSCCLCMSLTQTSESKTTKQSQVTRTLKSLKSLVKPFTTLSSSPDFSSIFLLLSSDSCTNKQEKQKPNIQILTTALSFETLVVKASNFSFMSESCKPAATTCTNQTNNKSLKMHSVQSFSEYVFQVVLYCLAITWQSHGNAISCLTFQAQCLKLFDNETLGGLQKQWRFQQRSSIPPKQEIQIQLH